MSKESNPFAGFKSEAFEAGEPVAEIKPAVVVEAAKPALTVIKEVADDAELKEAATETPDEGDSEDETGTSDESEPAKEEAKPKPKKSVDTRIGEITRARREAERERDAARAEIAALKASTKPVKEELTAPAKEIKEADKGRPNPADAKYQYGELDPKYIADTVRFETKQALAEAHAEADKTRQQEAEAQEKLELKDRYEAKLAEGAEKHEDFEEKVLKSKWDCSDIVASLILDSEVGADIAYHLASNPKEASKIYGLEPLVQAAAFGRLEAKFSANAAKPDIKVPQLDPPPKSPRGSGGKFSVDPATTDFAAFEAMANKVMRN